MLFPFAGGQVALFANRSPAKSTPNEDSAAVIPVGEDSGLLVVADGVGGFRGGDRASAVVVAMIKSAVQFSTSDNLRIAVLDGIENANRAIIRMGIGAGTTVVVAEIRGREIRPYHVGDSMMLGIGQRGKIRFKTVSHSPVGYAVESGMMNQQEAMRHEERHLVSNIVGTADMRIEIGPAVDVAARDTFVLASDGLFDNLGISEVVEASRKGPLHLAASRLAHEAARHMTNPEPDQVSKPDDLTMIVWRPHVHAADKSKHSKIINTQDWSEDLDLTNVRAAS